MARIELWIDWDEEHDFSGWQEEIKLNLDRFKEDDRYAKIVSDYITRGLGYLAKEIEQIDLMVPRNGLVEDDCE